MVATSILRFASVSSAAPRVRRPRFCPVPSTVAAAPLHSTPRRSIGPCSPPFPADVPVALLVGNLLLTLLGRVSFQGRRMAAADAGKIGVDSARQHLPFPPHPTVVLRVAQLPRRGRRTHDPTLSSAGQGHPTRRRHRPARRPEVETSGSQLCDSGGAESAYECHRIRGSELVVKVHRKGPTPQPRLLRGAAAPAPAFTLVITLAQCEPGNRGGDGRAVSAPEDH